LKKDHTPLGTPPNIFFATMTACIKQLKQDINLVKY